MRNKRLSTAEGLAGAHMAHKCWIRDVHPDLPHVLVQFSASKMFKDVPVHSKICFGGRNNLRASSRVSKETLQETWHILNIW